MIDESWVNFLKVHKENITKKNKSNKIEKKYDIKNKPKKYKEDIKNDRP